MFHGGRNSIHRQSARPLMKWRVISGEISVPLAESESLGSSVYIIDSVAAGEKQKASRVH